MIIKDIKNMWPEKTTDFSASLSWWDHKAPAFSLKKIPTREDSLAIELIEDNHMIEKGSCALDIGCGGGRFSFAMENMGADVLGFDFSPKMIEECEKAKEKLNSKAEFTVCNFAEADIEALGWKNKFDLVLANMTPAVNSANTFLKMCDASKNWCMMVKHPRRKSSVLDDISAELDFDYDNKKNDESILYAFDLLWLMGKKPKIEYRDEVWEKEFTLHEAIAEYTLRLSVSHELTTGQRAKIEKLLKERAKEGIIRETTTTTIAAIYWQV